MTDPELWAASQLPFKIVQLLESPKSLSQLADELQVTDARVLWYLSRLEAVGRVAKTGDTWVQTVKGASYIAAPPAIDDDCTVLPGRTVYDYQQAFADADAGMFGSTFVQASGEHGGRVPYDRALEFNQRLMDLIAEYFAPESVDRSATLKYGFHWVLTPTDLHPLDDR